jgi:hypothetical protein
MCIVRRRMNYTDLVQYKCYKRQFEVGGTAALYLRI